MVVVVDGGASGLEVELGFCCGSIEVRKRVAIQLSGPICDQSSSDLITDTRSLRCKPPTTEQDVEGQLRTLREDAITQWV